MSVNQVQTQVLIDSVDVTDHILSWEYIDSHVEGEIPTLRMELAWTVWGILSPDIANEVVVTRGTTTPTDENVFAGSIIEVQKKRPYVIVNCKNKLFNLVRRSITKSFDINVDTEAGVITEIFKTMINDYSDLTADNTSVLADTKTINQFICRNTDIYERVLVLAGYLGYNVYYDYDDDLVYFEPKGYVQNTTDLETGVNVIGTIVWTFDNSQLINKVRVDGAESYVDTVESGQIGVTTGWTTSQLQMQYSPFNVLLYADASSPPTTLKEGGVDDSSTTHDYVVDRVNNLIIWNTTNFTPGASDYVDVSYSYPVPVPVIEENPASIAAYGLTESVRYFSDITNVEDAIERADLIINTFSDPFISAKIKIRDFSAGYKAGELVRVVDTENDEDRIVEITEIRKVFPYQPDELKIGDKEYSIASYNAAIEDRIKRIEEEFTQNEDFLNIVYAMNRTIDFNRKFLRIDRSKIYDSFVLNHPINGVLGIAGLQMDDFESGNSGNWTVTGGSATISDESTNVIVGSGSLGLDISTTAACTIRRTLATSPADFSSYTGVAAGTPTKGTVGLWVYYDGTNGEFSDITLRLTDNTGDFVQYVGLEYSTVDGYENWGNLTFGLREGWNYYMFNLQNIDSSFGSIDWTVIDRVQIRFGTVTTGEIYLDYLTVSESEYIGINGLGDRSQLISQYLQQGQRRLREFLYSTDFIDTTSTTATVDTGTETATFAISDVLVTEKVDMSNTYTNFLVELGDVSDTLDIEVSGDNGTTFTPAANAILGTFGICDGTGVVIKLTNNTAGAVTLTNVLDSNGARSRAAIRVTLS